MDHVEDDAVVPAIPRSGESCGRPGLQAVHHLLDSLHQEGIPYCHWKSNEHLVEGMLGLTDLDLLVDRDSAQRLDRILSETGYKRFVAVPGRAYVGLEDALTADTTTGRLIHLHLHYQLTLGEKHLKGYRLPWEQVVLSTRRFERSAGIYVADPNVEMILLLVRSTLKIRWRDRVWSALGRPYLRDGELGEFLWLKERVQGNRLAGISETLLGTRGGRALVEAAEGEPSLRRLRAFGRIARDRLGLYRTYRPLEARLRRWAGEWRWARSVVARRLTHPATPRVRFAPRGGLLVALVGPDGSGKSTLVRHLVAWLSWKIDARAAYFGSGEGPSSILRWPMKIGLRVFRRSRLLRDDGAAGSAASGAIPGDRRPPSRTRGTLRALWALVLSLEKRGTLRRAWRGRNRGVVMLCDRYPQNQIMGFNDGPLLSHWRQSRSRLLRRIGRWEAVPYERAELNPPDLVIKMHVSPDVSTRRKPDVSHEEIRRRETAVASLKYPAPTRVLDIDANRDLEAVLLEAKRRIWQAL